MKNTIVKKIGLRFCAAFGVCVLMVGFAGCGKEDAGESGSQSAAETTVESSVQASEEKEPVQEEASADLQSLVKAVQKSQGDNYWPDTSMPAEYLEMTTGLTSDQYQDFVGEMPMISANIDTLLIVKAAEGQEDAVLETLQAYQDSLKANTMQYPMNLPKIQASRLERMGSYICFVMLGGDPGAAEEQGEEAMLQVYQERNEEAMNTIRETLGQ